MSLSGKINKIGARLVKCELGNVCEGITNDPNQFIIPRCLYLEPKDAKKIDFVIVGINPGKMSKKEEKYHRDHGITYEDTVNVFNQSTWRYAVELRELFTKKIALGDSILWTELCKCQSAEGVKEPPMQTFRRCMEKYLYNEINLIDKGTPLIGVGNQAYTALCYLFPEHPIIGVPHPTGSYGQWKQLYNNPQYILKAKEVIKQARKINGCARIFPTELDQSKK